jgi:hypothetical protein
MNADALNQRFPHKLVLISLLVVVPTFGIRGQTTNRPDDPLMMQSRVLRHRVQIVALPPRQGKPAPESVDTIILKSEGWKALLLEEGITIGETEWASAVDLLKAQTSTSEAFRVAGMPSRAQDGKTEMVMLARFGIGTTGSCVFACLLDGATGNTLASASARAASMQEAIGDVLASLENEAVLMPWRCRVAGKNDGAMIIDRGRLDGLRNSQRLVGYAMAPEAAKQSEMNLELLVMQFGTRKGLYEVVEEGQEFCKVAPVDGAPVLTTGDVLELPAVALKDRQPNSRSHRVWDKLYK